MVSPVSEGDILAGKFRIDKVLGVGGMGVVVAAHHLQLDETVALKFLLPESLSNPGVVERFAREARAAVKIKSEHVARVSDVGVLDNGSPYMVMEYLKGCDLRTLLESKGRFSVAEAIEYLLQACEAIAEAHQLGIVHRDLKPANLFLVQRADGSPCVKVLDFGISKLTTLSGSGGSGALTQTASLLGSPFYMSPEQLVSGKNVDARSDIWALGVILYELLGGRVPFEAETIAELCVRILQSDPPDLRTLRPDLPPGLERALSGALEKDRQRRFGSVADFARALAPFAPPRASVSIERVAGIGVGASGGGMDLTGASPLLAAPQQQTVDNGWGRSEAKSGTPTAVKVVVGLGAFGLVVMAAVVYLAVKTPWAATHAESSASVASAEPAAPPPLNAPQPAAQPEQLAVTPTAPNVAPPEPEIPASTTPVHTAAAGNVRSTTAASRKDPAARQTPVPAVTPTPAPPPPAKEPPPPAKTASPPKAGGDDLLDGRR